ncbi:hypothetical protein E4U21_005476 [Claviceps maximensis]|nr:hypothetical protein E4U21_005476 [Claviceps maximensis]
MLGIITAEWASTAPPFLATAFVLGVLLHVVFFNRGEWDLHTMPIIRRFVGTFVALPIILMIAPLLLDYVPSSSSSSSSSSAFALRSYLSLLSSFSLWNRFVFAFCLAGCLLLGLFTSILVYRACFHRLNRFPGPFAARLSNFYITRLATRKLQLYREVQNLHQVYGDYVRVGPSEISINDAKAVAAIHSNSSPCGKGPWYNIEQPAVSVHMTRNKDEHTRRRKTWDKAFSTKALRDYEPRVLKYTNLLFQRIRENQGIPFDASKWFNFYSFDVMGDMAFGENFNMLNTGQAHSFMKLIHKHLVVAGLFNHLVWMFPLFKAMPILNREDSVFQDWLVKQVSHREKNRPDVPDVFSWLLSDFEALERPRRQDRLNLQADMQLIAIAGSDTTATTLSSLFFFLAKNKAECVKLQQEIDTCFPGGTDLDQSKLSKMKFLQACINETLRLLPPVPSGLQRMTPPEGLMIGEKFIPGETIVTIPSYTQYRDERFFALPNSFIPERWTTRPELVKDGSVYVPFGNGKYACVGKALGLMEVRLVTSTILRQFDIDLAHEGAEAGFFSGLKDCFTLSPSDLSIVFTARK